MTRVSVTHGEFGAIDLRFEHTAGALAVAMHSADPDFAASARTALADRAQLPGDPAARTEPPAGRSDTTFASSGQTHAQPQSHGQQQQHQTLQRGGESGRPGRLGGAPSEPSAPDDPHPAARPGLYI